MTSAALPANRPVGQPPRALVSSPPVTRSAPVSLLTASLLIALVVVRLVDFLGPINRLRPGLFLTLGGTLLLWATADRLSRSSLWSNRFFLIPTAYLCWAAATIPTALWRGQAYEAIRGLGIAIMILAGILLLPPSRSTVQRLTATFVLACTVYVVLLFATGKEIVSGRYAVGATLDANDAGSMFAIAVPFALALSQRNRSGVFRLAWLGLAGVLAVGMVFTGSRGGSLALLAALGMYLVGLRGRKRALYSLLALVGGFLAWQSAPDSYRLRMQALFSGEKDYNYTEYTGRTQIWKRGVTYWSRNPILGVGIGNFATAEGDYLKEQGNTGKWSAPHNTYVQSFAELGTPGGLLLLAIILMAGRTAFELWRGRGAPPEPEYLAALAAFAAGSYFLSNAYSYLLFALVGIIAQAGQLIAHSPGPASLPGANPPARTSGWRTARWTTAVHPGRVVAR